MPSNIEIKARVQDVARLRAEVESLCDGPAEVLDQLDVYFHVPGGRLKLRTRGDRPGELIFYHREDADVPRPSRYLIAATGDPDVLTTILGSVLGVLGVVRKRRLLYRVGPTRIHLDDVEGLGHFVELEVVLRPDQPDDEGVTVARRLMDRLGVAGNHLVLNSYIELLVNGR